MTIGLGLALFLAAGAPATSASANLLAWSEGAPEGGWTRWAPRPSLAPGYAAESGSEPSLRVTGNGNPHVFGGWRRVTAVRAFQPYRLEAEARASGIGSRGSVLCQVRWLGPRVSEDVAPEYAAEAPGSASGTIRWRDVLTAPPHATEVEVSLVVQWAPSADIAFRDVSLRAS